MDKVMRVHLMGICGAGMGALAGLFHEKGHQVTGSDQGAYPPMSDFLAKLGIPVHEGYKASNLQPNPDLVVVGNVIRRDNPEATALMESDIKYCSMPEAINRFFTTDRRQVVVTGTHGKSTVSSMISWILEDNGLSPGFFIGAAALNFGRSYQLGAGRHFVIEGDEYDTAFYEKTPKMINYKPHIGVITSCEFDHGDIYDSIEDIGKGFKVFAGMIPEDGALVAFGDDPTVREMASPAAANSHIYGFDQSAQWSVSRLDENREGSLFEIFRSGESVGKGILRQTGAHNLANALCAIVVSSLLGISPRDATGSLERFEGVKRRQEILAEINQIILMDDFAHHPTAVRETITGVKSRYPDRRLVAIFEPRTNTSRRAVFQKDYAEALSYADTAFIKEPERVEKLSPEDRFSATRLVEDLRAKGIEAKAFHNVDEMVDCLRTSLRPKDLALSMSNGDFGGLNPLLIKALNGGSQ
jgi:UDP-N-acetylmuramate: L-alanyl-gamma-D-glutamyl-meso-diaminopimelate ligase